VTRAARHDAAGVARLGLRERLPQFVLLVVINAFCRRDGRHGAKHPPRDGGAGNSTSRRARRLSRFWRDLGYAAADRLGIAGAMQIVAVLTFVSGLVVALRMHETLMK
jgi:hypothetical protein